MRKRKANPTPCLYQKHGRWWFVKAGKWTKLSKDYAEALVEYARLQAAPKTGMPALIDQIFKRVSPKLKPNTVKQYRLAADRLKSILVEFAPEQVRPRDIAAIKHAYAKTPAMANRMVSFLRMVFQEAVDMELVDANPCVGVKRFEESKRGRYVTDAEYLAVRAVACQTLVAVMDLLYLTGQRVGDLLALRLSEISDQGIAFRQQKTDKRLLVKMTPELKAAIDRARALPRGVRGMTLLCSRKGTPYAYKTIRDMLARATAKAGVEDFHLHDLRAKAITDAQKQGKDPRRLAGHTTEAQTVRYIRQHEIEEAEPPSFRHSLDN